MNNILVDYPVTVRYHISKYKTTPNDGGKTYDTSGMVR